MNKNETALEMCLRMLKERAKYWNLEGDQPPEPSGRFLRGTFFGKADAYNSAVSMLKYAMQDNIECLRQFDYYHEDKEEE